MDFDDTPSEADFRAAARAWLSANATPRSRDGDWGPSTDDAAGIEACKAWQARKADAGWACIHWPREYGGRGASAIESLIWSQEESGFAVPPSIFHIGHGQAGPTLMTHGTAEQKARWLPKMIRGEDIWCQLFSEPDAGSDLAGLRTRAVRDGDHWVVNGQKVWTSGAGHSDWAVLIARTDPDVPKHAGLTYFVLDMKTPGIEIRPIRQIWGSAEFCAVFLTDVRIPDEHRISSVGNGWAVTTSTLTTERAAVTGGVVGPAGERLPTSRDLIRLAMDTRTSGGRRALDDVAVRERIADFHVRWRGLVHTSYRILTALSRGQAPGNEASIGKLVEGRLQQEMAAVALDLLEGSGTIADTNGAMAYAKWQWSYLVAPAIRIAGGTDEILRNIIAERILDLPPEPRTDKGKPFKELRSTPTRTA
ncbi:MAG: acyl-CoA dehydrogenase family protein [Dehalococcoidia bacterium]